MCKLKGMTMKTIRDWYTMSEAAKELGVSRQRMHQITDELNIKRMQITPRLSAISRKDIEKLKKIRNAD